jgi:antitoxin component of RelBE/YafQ-DinJ toxin-antitoxin module
MSDGINIFLRQVQINKGFPFEVKIQDRLRLKKWSGHLPGTENPAHIKNYRKIPREELYGEH